LLSFSFYLLYVIRKILKRNNPAPRLHGAILQGPLLIYGRVHVLLWACQLSLLLIELRLLLLLGGSCRSSNHGPDSSVVRIKSCVSRVATRSQEVATCEWWVVEWWSTLLGEQSSAPSILCCGCGTLKAIARRVATFPQSAEQSIQWRQDTQARVEGEPWATLRCAPASLLTATCLLFIVEWKCVVLCTSALSFAVSACLSCGGWLRAADATFSSRGHVQTR
jgi:hypothetical protein